MTETMGRQWLTRKCKNQKSIMLYPIESSRTRLGIPDIFFRTTLCDGWLELKQIVTNSLKSFMVPFRPLQYEWLMNYTALDGNAILTIFVETREGNCVAFFKRQNIKLKYTWEEYLALSILNGFIKDITYTDLFNAFNEQ